MRQNTFLLLFLFAAFCISGCDVTLQHKSYTQSMTPRSLSGTAAKAVGKKPPVLSETSTAKDIAAYAAYYKAHGYLVTENEQAFSPEGKLLSFRFKASRNREADKASVSVAISPGETTTSESTTTNE